MDVNCQQNLDFLWLVQCLPPLSLSILLESTFFQLGSISLAILAQFSLPYQEITFSLRLVTQTLRNKMLIISTSFVLYAWAEKSIKKIKEVRRTRTKSTRWFNSFIGKARVWLVSNFEAWQSRTYVSLGYTNKWFKIARLWLHVFQNKVILGSRIIAIMAVKMPLSRSVSNFKIQLYSFKPVFKHLKFDASRFCFYRMR